MCREANEDRDPAVEPGATCLAAKGPPSEALGLQATPGTIPGTTPGATPVGAPGGVPVTFTAPGAIPVTCAASTTCRTSLNYPCSTGVW